MNSRKVLNVLGKVMLIMAFFLCVPVAVALLYKENNLINAFLMPACGLVFVGGIFILIPQKEKGFFNKEGLTVVALSWVVMALVGAIPFVLSREIPNYIDALFETISGLSTTGATVLDNVESLSHCTQFWRIFTHWIGGMGVLVFLLAIIPSKEEAMHIYRAESPGPSASKLVSKMGYTARILYAIYIVLTIIQIIMLLCGGLSIYDSVLTAFSTAGTGGFSMYNDSIAHFNSLYVEIVVAVFMFIFGTNFNVFFLILIGQFKKAIKSEEFIAYSTILICSIFIIAINLLSISYNFFDALRYAFFQVNSVSSTTGFFSEEFANWPALSKSILTFLMIMGACGGSTGGGVKVARLIILFKSFVNDIKKMIHPRAVTAIKFEGETLDKNVESNVRTYTIVWIILVVISTIILSIDYNDLFTNLSATISCIGNVGPVMNSIGATFSYSVYAPYSKVLLSLLMLAGRLEIFPVIVLFSISTWKK